MRWMVLEWGVGDRTRGIVVFLDKLYSGLQAGGHVLVEARR